MGAYLDLTAGAVEIRGGGNANENLPPGMVFLLVGGSATTVCELQ